LRFRKIPLQALLFVLLAALVWAQPPVAQPPATQPPAAPAPQPVPGPKAVKIVVMQGEGAKNSIKVRTATQPAVEVRDENDKPVAGAEVIFRLPASGPGGVFNDWMRTQTARTNAQGQAGASGFTPNDQEGRFNIKVTASMGSADAEAVIAQSNVLSGSGGSNAKAGKSKWWKPVLVLALGGIAGGAYKATRGGSTPAPPVPPNPVTISAGPVTVGNPR
jgi:hypothetical protein